LQPQRLFETERLYVIPDKYPLHPGHTLIITKRHLRCYGLADDATLRELDETAALVRPFLERSYGAPVLALENGIAGQSVFHAHLHLIPLAIGSIPPELARHEDVIPVGGWQDVTNYLTTRGHYRYLQSGERRYVVAGYSRVLGELRRLLAEATGLTFGSQGWEKRTTERDVRSVNQRWQAWVAGAE
jgi:histidine triad (HIT) family protein